jgi:hypothetical protein
MCVMGVVCVWGCVCVCGGPVQRTGQPLVYFIHFSPEYASMPLGVSSSCSSKLGRDEKHYHRRVKRCFQFKLDDYYWSTGPDTL